MADTDKRTRIGVTGPRSGAFGPRTCVKLALRLCGASAVQLRPGDPVDFEELDGFVITGGHDIQPVLYRAAAEAGRTYDPERDAFESAVIDHALAQRLPLLAICRGAQLMNVRLGGSLIQDLTLRRKETSNRRTLLPLKSLAVEPDTLLERALRTTSAKINSLHRQAIDDIGEGLEVSGTDRDQIVQAVEHPGHDFMLAVQWHPEFLFYLGRQRRLFAQLVAAARNAANR